MRWPGMLAAGLGLTEDVAGPHFPGRNARMILKWQSMAGRALADSLIRLTC
jgi:hypothetical protein